MNLLENKIQITLKLKKNKLNMWLTAPKGATPVN